MRCNSVAEELLLLADCTEKRCELELHEAHQPLLDGHHQGSGARQPCVGGEFFSSPEEFRRVVLVRLSVHCT